MNYTTDTLELKSPRTRRPHGAHAVKDGKKICSKCGEMLPVSRFSKCKSTVTGYAYACKQCNKEHEQKPEVKEARKWYWKKYHYNLTEYDYKAMFESQDGRCPICNRKFPYPKLVPDHIEGTVVVRSLLCTSCNTALGKFRHSPAILKRAIAYINN
jgi:hypothetical protein